MTEDKPRSLKRSRPLTTLHSTQEIRLYRNTGGTTAEIFRWDITSTGLHFRTSAQSQAMAAQTRKSKTGAGRNTTKLVSKLRSNQGRIPWELQQSKIKIRIQEDITADTVVKVESWSDCSKDGWERKWCYSCPEISQQWMLSAAGNSNPYWCL